MDKRALIGIALSILVLVVYQQLVTHFYGPLTVSAIPESGDESGGKSCAGGAKHRRAVSHCRQLPRPRLLSAGQIGQRNYGRNGSRTSPYLRPRGAAQRALNSKISQLGRRAQPAILRSYRTAPGVPVTVGCSLAGADAIRRQRDRLFGTRKRSQAERRRQSELGFPGTKWQRRGHNKIFHLLQARLIRFSSKFL